MNLMNCITLTLNQIFNLLVIINKDNMVSLRGGQGATHALTAPTPTAPAPTGPASTALASGKKQWDLEIDCVICHRFHFNHISNREYIIILHNVKSFRVRWTLR